MANCFYYRETGEEREGGDFGGRDAGDIQDRAHQEILAGTRMPLVIQTSASRGLLGGYEHITRLAVRRQQIRRLSAVEMMMVEFHFFIQTARHGVRALPTGTTQTTYGLPQKEQTAPS